MADGSASDDIIPQESLSFTPQAAPSSVDDIIPPISLKAPTAKATKPSTDLEVKHGPLGFVNALGEIAGKSIGNIPMGAVHGAKDLLSRATGGGPRPSEPTFPLSQNAQSAAQGIGDALSTAAEPYRVRAAEPFIKDYVAPVLNDVGAIAPVTGAVKGILGRLAPREAVSAVAPTTAEPVAATEPAKPLTATGAERPAYFDIADPKATEELGIKHEKIEAQEKPTGGALSDAQQAARLALAKRVGLKEVRSSAISGDAQAAADDFDSTKYTGDPMGERIRGVMKNERQAMSDHASGIIDDLGAKEGSNQSTLLAKGKIMTKPLDMLADHIDASTTKAYEAAREKGGSEPVIFPQLERALTDKTLTNSLLAQGKEGFLKGVQSQWDDFKANNPEGVNAGVAEQYRQFLNTLWKTNPDAVTKLKTAMDSDMHAHFGEDLFGEARQLHQLGNKLLGNPKGVAQIVGKDPHTPVNRTTSFEDIPDKVANMTGEQFKNLINTYKMMPDELQPQAQAAIKEIQGHMVNRLLDAGSKHETQWNKKGVNSELDNNSENFKTAFSDNPQAAAKIKDLKDAGEMLRFNSGYRGAHAQASNMERSGVGKGAANVAGAIGGTVGHMVAGPMGIIPGAAAGKMGVGKSLGALDKSRILKAVEGRVTQVP